MMKRAKAEDAKALADLAIQMWTEHDIEDMAEEFRKLLMNEEAVCFIKYEGEKPIGFAQCQLRHDYVEGTESSPAGYLEGILVSEGYRKKGYAAELLSECEKWAEVCGRSLDHGTFGRILSFSRIDQKDCIRKKDRSSGVFSIALFS